jgi:hypothetical protein
VASNERHFLGEWRQVNPPTGSDNIFINFETEGRLTYSIEGDTTQHFILTWKVVGSTVVSDQPSVPREEVTPFHFESPSRLVLEREDERYVYERC